MNSQTPSVPEVEGCSQASSAPPCSASALLAQWKEAIHERDKALSRRGDNMFLGPMGIEEQLSVTNNDVRMNAWFLNKLIEVVADIESKMPNDRSEER